MCDHCFVWRPPSAWVCSPRVRKSARLAEEGFGSALHIDMAQECGAVAQAIECVAIGKTAANAYDQAYFRKDPVPIEELRLE